MLDPGLAWRERWSKREPELQDSVEARCEKSGRNAGETLDSFCLFMSMCKQSKDRRKLGKRQSGTNTDTRRSALLNAATLHNPESEVDQTIRYLCVDFKWRSASR